MPLQLAQAMQNAQPIVHAAPEDPSKLGPAALALALRCSLPSGKILPYLDDVSLKETKMDSLEGPSVEVMGHHYPKLNEGDFEKKQTAFSHWLKHVKGRPSAAVD